jgi:Fic family protein
MFIRMHVLKEATQSSKIEGTRTNMQEALMDKSDVPADKRDDWQEVHNYIDAMNNSIDALEKLPFSSRMMRSAHKILMQGVRGDKKQPGEFRTSQNWIGGAAISDAIFIPPPHTSINAFMGDLEKFAHNETLYFPELLKIALIHYQFETIHPFLDGNGRVGRLMITLYLVSKGILKKPVLYLSDFMAQNRTLYYDNLMRVREKNDLTQWFKFFLTGIIETAKNGISTFDAILQLQKQTEAKVDGLGSRAANAQKVCNYLYQKPMINAEMVKNVTGITLPSAYTLISELERLKILNEVTGGQRGKMYVFESYLKLFKS